MTYDHVYSHSALKAEQNIDSPVDSSYQFTLVFLYASLLQSLQNHRSRFVLFWKNRRKPTVAIPYKMWAAPKTPPKRSVTVFDDDDSPSAKRRRFAISPSQDSDESGQTPLGITFGDTPRVLIQKNGFEMEIVDSQDDVDAEEISAKATKQFYAKKSSAQHVNNDKDSPERASVSSINIDDIPIIASPKHVQNRLNTKYFTFNLREVKAIVRWMRMHRTYKISSHKTEFNELVHHLGYSSASLSQKDQNELRTKLRTKMGALHANMKKSGALAEDYDGYESSGSTVFRPLPFEEWTLMWYKKGWDGSLHRPYQKKYEAIMNERGDDCASSNDAGKKGAGAQPEQDIENRSEQGHEKTEKQNKTTLTLSDDEFDGTELFMVEETSEVTRKEDRPPPKDDKSRDVDGWNTYLLNKEIIDEHDWNYRIVTAQHLGIDLKELAALYPDPFPGYEHPPRESSAFPVTPTRSVASSAQSTPSTPSPAPTKTTDRPDSDESISLEVTDSEDDRVPGTRAIQYVNDSDEDMGDDEMEEEDLADDAELHAGHQSQGSTTNAVQHATDTQITTQAPSTPKRPISRQSHTPRSVTPSIYTAIWSPKQ
ncbi:hypothetical protein ONS95_008170 [Cadophora gregata]|uniref:uncharacterized protein n=1 Tax=Cadophora gregata TaxID=51156 RepID=UPI0026DACB7E|nr:uncharacterized protein ONS95_008170 [Cadophora gregata]KAK0119328.1 hypothetical protein ONS96_012381 [Cadophora gregata f. sp. sojae]KAK0126582.1 hypothetical protein ONS95_008170 [Cadophora gregata]